MRLRGLLSLVPSTGYAVRGLWWAVRTNFHVGLVFIVAALATLAGVAAGIAPLEWAALLLAAALVLAAELVNSAIEATLDAVHPERDPLVGRAKDVAAAAVLVCIAAAGGVALLVFAPRLLR